MLELDDDEDRDDCLVMNGLANMRKVLLPLAQRPSFDSDPSWGEVNISSAFLSALRGAAELPHGVSQLLTCQPTQESPRRRAGPLRAASRPSPRPTAA